jgi:membrane glycosyltransferase
MAGHHSNEALLEQIKASDQWSFYQAKGIKAEIRSLGKESGKNDQDAVDKYKKEQGDIKKEAEAAQNESADHLKKHIILSRAVTLFQIAIAISAISILTRKKFLWYSGIALAMAGIVFFVMGFL